MKECNKKICLMGWGVYFWGMILTILLGVVLNIRFEIMNVILVLVALAYAFVLSKIQGDEEV